MTASFHPPDEFLVAYGAGSLDEATALLIATHVALCPRCRNEIARIETLGGAMLDDLPLAELRAGALDAVLARLDEPAPLPRRAPLPQRSLGATAPSFIPEPLRSYLGSGIDEIRWKRLANGLEQSLVLESGRARARLYRIAPGVTIPEHGHEGNELTLVLQGGFSDINGHYGRGDVASADGAVIHHPVADRDGACICLAVTDAPLQLTGLLGRLVSPFLNL